MTKDIKVEQQIVDHLKRRIIIQENRNLKNRERNDVEMVAWIKKEIEGEVQ